MLEEKNLNPLYSAQLFGLKNYFQELVEMEKKNVFPNVLMLSGKKGIGKFTLINHYLNYFFSKKNYDYKNQIIDLESEVFRSHINQTFENIIYIQNENYNGAKVDDIRNLKNIINKSTLNSKPRFIILDDAEQLNLNSVNALLKILEEPSENNFFILINNQQKEIVETIESRCLKIKVFLKNDKRIEIIEKLLEINDSDTFLSFDNSSVTPGLFLNFNHICQKFNIDIKDNYLNNLKLVLDLYKKDKKTNYIKLSEFIIDNHFNFLSKKEVSKKVVYYNIKTLILNHLNNFVKLNLSINSFFNLIKKDLVYAE